MKTLVSIMFALLSPLSIMAQEFVPIWNDREMPHSKGIEVKDSMDNEIIYKVGTPGLHVFTPSKFIKRKSAVIIIPGGGYAHQAYRLSGFEMAKWFNTLGITSFVLKYRLPQSIDNDTCYKVALADAQRAVKYIRANSEQLGIDTGKIGVWGCSAGGHLAACLSTIKEDWSKPYDKDNTISFRPNFAILVSPVISMTEHVHKSSKDNLLGNTQAKDIADMFSCEKQVGKDTPPTFIIHALNDKTVSCNNSLMYFESLEKKKIKNCSLHIYPNGGHGINITNNSDITSTWLSLLQKWLSLISMI